MSSSDEICVDPWHDDLDAAKASGSKCPTCGDRYEDVAFEMPLEDVEQVLQDLADVRKHRIDHLRDVAELRKQRSERLTALLQRATDAANKNARDVEAALDAKVKQLAKEMDIPEDEIRRSLGLDK